MLQLSALLLCLGHSASELTPSQLIERSLKARTEIKSLSYKMRIESQFVGEPDQGSKTKWVWYTPESFRLDHDPFEKPNAQPRQVQILGCEGNYLFDYIEEKNVTSTMTPMAKFDPKQMCLACYNPIAIGYICKPFYLVRKDSVDSLLKDLVAAKPKLTEAQSQGKPILQLAGNVKLQPTGIMREVVMQFDPANNYTVSLIQYLEKGRVIAQCKSEQFVTRGSVSFPTRHSYEEYDAKGKTERREVATFSNVQINEPIPPVTFTRAGVNMAPGTLTQGPKPGEPGAWIWDGTAIVPMPKPVFTKPPEPSAGGPVPVEAEDLTRWYWLAACVGLSMVAVLLVLRRWGK